MDRNIEYNKCDINIRNISTQYGSPKETFETFKSTINKAFENLGLLEKFGAIHNVRIPYGQELNVLGYYGFLTMKDIATHEQLLFILNNIKIKFGNLALEFRQGFSHRADLKQENNEISACKSNYTGLRGNERSISTSSIISKRRRVSDDDYEVVIVDKKDSVSLQEEYQLVMNKSQQQFIQEKLDELKTRETEVISRETRVIKQEEYVADKKIIVNTAMKTLKELKDKFLKERWMEERNVILHEQLSLKRRRENGKEQWLLQEKSWDIEEETLAKKKESLNERIKQMNEQDKLIQETRDDLSDNSKENNTE
jgi:hypothetical protein